MAERNVRVRITAQVQEYIDGMEKAAKATHETGSAAEKLAQQRQAFDQLGRTAMAFGAAAAVGVGLAVSKWADFDEAMSAVQAATHESEASMKLLSDAALDAGARTVFSAEESANAIEELAKAGVSTADILNGALDGALDLAAAGGLDVATAAGIAATALKTFNLEGTDMAHVSDLLAAGAGKAMGDVTDLSAALNQSAMVANATGLSLEETTAGLAAFASQGLLGSDAGTSFKSMLQSLTPTSGKAADEMARLGISAYDSQGNFVGLAEFAGQLKGSLSELTVEQQQSALKTIFGSDAIRAATVLYSEGEEGIRDWIDAVDDQGYAAKTAAARLDNLKGDIEALGGALDTALIKTGSGANEVLRGMTQWLTEAVDAYNDLPPVLQSVTLGAGLLTAGVGLLGGGFLLTINKIAEFKIAMATLGVTSARASGALMGLGRFLLGPWGIALAVAAASAHVFKSTLQEGSSSAAELESAITNAANQVGVLEQAMSGQGDVSKFFWGDYVEELENLGTLLNDTNRGGGMWEWLTTDFDDAEMLSRVREVGKGMVTVAQTDLPKVQAEFKDMADKYRLNREEAGLLLNRMPELRDHLIGVADDMGVASNDANLLKIAMGELGPKTDKAADSAKTAADQFIEQAEASNAAADELNSLIDALNEYNGVGQSVETTNARYQSTLAAVAETIANAHAGLDGYSTSMDANTEAGSKNREMFAGMAQDSQTAAKALFDHESATLGADTAIANYTQSLSAGRQALVDQITELTGSREAAELFADSVYKIPTEQELKMLNNSAQATAEVNAYEDRLKKIAPEVWTQLQVNTGPAQTALESFLRANDGRSLSFHAGVMGSENGNIVAYANGGITAYADGGVSPYAAPFQAGIYSGGAPIHKFAEPETGWEAYISGKPSERARNRQIWVDSGERLGMGPVIKDAVNAAVTAALSAGVQREPSRSTSFTFVNPVVRDDFQDAWDGAQERGGYM